MQRSASASAPPSRYRWVILGVLLFLAAARLAVLPSLGILLPDIAGSFDIGPAQQGLLVGVISTGNVVLGLPAAWFFSRYPASWLCLASAASATALFLLQSSAPSFAVMLPVQALIGFSFLSQSTASAILGTGWFPVREQVFVSGTFNAAAGLIEVIAFNVVGPALRWTGSWRAVVAGLSGFWLAGTLLWVLLGREPPRRDEHSSGGASVWPILQERRMRLAALGAFGPVAAWVSYVSFWPAHMLAAHDAPLEAAGFVLGMSSLGQVPASLLFGWTCSRRPGLRPAILLGSGLVLATTGIGMLLTDSLPVLTTLAAVQGIAWGYLPLLAAVPYEIPGFGPRQVAMASSFVWSCSSLGALLGPVLAGAIAQQAGSFVPALALLSCFSLLVCLSALTKRPVHAA